MPKTGKAASVQIGEVYGYLTVIGFSHQDTRWRRHFLCRCICGTEKTVQSGLLRSGNTKSCGCLVAESARTRILPHGEASMRQVISGYKHKAKKNNISFSLTTPQFKKIALAPCFYCGEIESNVHRSPYGTGDFSYNGLDKIDPSKGYVFGNVVSCCKRCNFAKSNHSQGDFIRWVSKIYKNLHKTVMAEQWGDL